MIQGQALSVRIGRATLLEDVDVEVVPGEVLAIVGPNGAGKSTLLRLLAGDRRPSAGTLTLDGRALEAYASLELARRRAVLPQFSTLSFGFRAREVVAMGRAPFGQGNLPHDARVIEMAMQLAGLSDDFAERDYTTLSGGEAQRVHFARVLAQLLPLPEAPARYLMLDEPTASLDLAQAQEILAITQEIARAGAGCLVVVHDLNLAARFADRIMVLHQGQRRADGSPGQVLTPTLIKAVFGLEVDILDHPHEACPIVVPRRGTSTRVASLDLREETHA